MTSLRAACVGAMVLCLPVSGFASGRRDAPMVALDRAADIGDVFAFRAYDGGATPSVALIMTVDSSLEPASGPLWFPFDPAMRYELNVDNDNDAVADVRFVFRFDTEQLLPDLPLASLGAGGGVTAPANSPPPVAPGTLVVPRRIDALDGDGLAVRQRYTVAMTKNGVTTQLANGDGSPFYAAPANVGPRTLDYGTLKAAATYALANGIKVFAGTTDDPFFADTGALFDTFNVRAAIAPGVLSNAQDAANVNIAADSFAGFAVNAIAIQVPVSVLTRTGQVEPATSTAATIGVWAATLRNFKTTRQPPKAPKVSGKFTRVQRMGNPYVNQLLVGLASKDAFSVAQPKNDATFASFVLDPYFARVLNALSGGAIPIPSPPRTDLLPLLTYAPPIAAAGTPAGPVADLLRLNTGVAPTPLASAVRLGLLGGDPAGFPNGRRVVDDVTDVVLRLVAGVLAPGFNVFPNNKLADGVNVNDASFPASFPYLAAAPSGRDRRHIDPGEAGCTQGAGAACAP